MHFLGSILVPFAVLITGESQPAPDLRLKVQEALINAVQQGAQVNIYFVFLGTRARGKIARADKNALVVNTAGYDVDVSWNDVPNENLANAASYVVTSAPELFIIAQYYKFLKALEKAEETANKALAADPLLQQQVDDFIKSLYPEKPKVDTSSMIKVLAPEKTVVQKRMPVRSNHENRPLGITPPVSQPILFNTKDADAVLAALQIFPIDNPWNQDIAKNPIHPNSDNIINTMGKDGTIGHNTDMAFVLIPQNQPKIEVPFQYRGESEPGPYPIPNNAPIEGLADQYTGEGDRHVIVVDSAGMILYEMFHCFRTENGWKAACGAIFDMKTNNLRRKGWTSSDAAGLPIFPAIVRFDECERGMVEHALRVTARHTRRKYLYPARHYASDSEDPNRPAMGQRLRLKADVNISGFSKHAKAVALAMKKYGMFVADNGMDWLISTAPDDRITGLRDLRKLKGGDFEVVVTNDEYGKPQQ